MAYVHEVRAALTFKDKDMHEIGHGVHQACWVDNHLKNASFDLEETHCIILAVMRVDDNNTRVVSPYIKEHMTEWGMGLSVEVCVLEKMPTYVELILVGNGKRLLEPMLFELYEENGKPQIKLVAED